MTSQSAVNHPLRGCLKTSYPPNFMGQWWLIIIAKYNIDLYNAYRIHDVPHLLNGHVTWLFRAIPNFLDSSPALHRQISTAWVVRRGHLGTTLVWFNIPSWSCSEYHPVLSRCHSMLRDFGNGSGARLVNIVYLPSTYLNMACRPVAHVRFWSIAIHSRYVDSGVSWTLIATGGVLVG